MASQTKKKQSKSGASDFYYSNGVNDYKRIPVPFSREQLRSTFVDHDLDDDGRLSLPELISAFKYFGSNAAWYRAVCSLCAADANRDGYISLDELDRVVDYAVRRNYKID